MKTISRDTIENSIALLFACFIAASMAGVIYAKPEMDFQEAITTFFLLISSGSVAIGLAISISKNLTVKI